ncbi:hypothetical protein ABW19_dt0205781 [Dactylella cylindrospora]|nr:hypothetical protein ABW19_dt0205781 [Dactylella cylindrospora]
MALQNQTFYQTILDPVLEFGVDYKWPSPCENLEAKYIAIEPDFKYLNVCIVYPDILVGLNENAFDENFISILSGWGINGSPGLGVAEDITSQTIDFLMDACDNIDCNNDLSRENDRSCNGTTLQADQGRRLDINSVFSCRDAICKNLEKYVKDDPDIGGIGVFISYLLQIFLVLLMSVYILWKYVIHERRVDPDNMHSPFVGSVAFPEALQDFQKLQSWFIGSLVVAAFIRQYQEITNISVTDFLFLGGISLNGVVLICYMNAALLLLGRKSWYVFGLSCVTFGMCSAFLLYANWKRVERVDGVLPALAFCQPQLSALKYADEITNWVRLVSKLPQVAIYVAWAFCATVQLGCVFWMLEWDKLLPHGFKRWTKGRTGKVSLWAVSFFIMLAFIAIFGLQMVMLYNFWGIVDPVLWSFGQIIAVTIWLPVVIDYFHGRYKERRERIRDHYLKTSGDYTAIPLQPQQPAGNTPSTSGFLGFSTPAPIYPAPYEPYGGGAAPPTQYTPPHQAPSQQLGQYGLVQPQPTQDYYGFTDQHPRPQRPYTHPQAGSHIVPPPLASPPSSFPPHFAPTQGAAIYPDHATDFTGNPPWSPTNQQPLRPPSTTSFASQTSQLAQSPPVPAQPYPRPPGPPSAWDQSGDYFSAGPSMPRRREVGSRRQSGASDHSRERSGSLSGTGNGPV